MILESTWSVTQYSKAGVVSLSQNYRHHSYNWPPFILLNLLADQMIVNTREEYAYFGVCNYDVASRNLRLCNLLPK